MTPLEKAARAAYEDWIADVRDLEPAWDDLPDSHRDRMISSQRAAFMAVREPDEGMAHAGHRERGYGSPSVTFTAMIDHILRGGE